MQYIPDEIGIAVCCAYGAEHQCYIGHGTTSQSDAERGESVG